MQLERILRAQGFGSRAECRALIASERVSIDGTLCDDPLLELAPEGLVIVVDGVEWRVRPQVYLAMHKPEHYECSHKPRFYPSVYSLLPRPLVNRNTQAVGRLDEDTTGLLILSDDGQFIHRCTSPKKVVPKVYHVTTRHPLDEEQVERLLTGVVLNDDPAPVLAAACEIMAPNLLRLTITEGKYHQVKRMVAAVGNRVEKLHRQSIGTYVLHDDLAPGQWRWLEAADVEAVMNTAAA